MMGHDCVSSVHHFHVDDHDGDRPMSDLVVSKRRAIPLLSAPSSSSRLKGQRSSTSLQRRKRFQVSKLLPWRFLLLPLAMILQFHYFYTSELEEFLPKNDNDALDIVRKSHPLLAAKVEDACSENALWFEASQSSNDREYAPQRGEKRQYYPRIAVLHSPCDRRIDLATKNTDDMWRRQSQIRLETSYADDRGNNITIIATNLTKARSPPPPPPDISAGCTAPLHPQPTCNSVHEIDRSRAFAEDEMRKLGKGGVRNVWSVIDASRLRKNEKEINRLWYAGKVSYVIKTLRWKHEFDPMIYESQRLETIAMDFLSSSPAVTNIYSFCATSTISNFASLGNLIDYIRNRTKRPGDVALTSPELLRVAVGLARGVSDMQDRNRVMIGSGYDARIKLEVVHRDIGAANILLSKGKPTFDVRLDDFNHAYVLRRYDANASLTEKACTYRDNFVCGEDGRRSDTRSTEECMGDPHLSEKIDTYGIGTVFFYLLTLNRTYAFDIDAPGPPREHIEWYRNRVIKGVAPTLPPQVESNLNPAVVAIKKAMRDAMTSDPSLRPNAREIFDFLDHEYEKLKALALLKKKKSKPS